MPESYEPCLCGSGKKFKWCCQSIFPKLDKALKQIQNNQFDAGKRILEEIIVENPKNPIPHIFLAEDYIMQNDVDNAEKHLDKILEIEPKHPIPFLMRGHFRRQEGDASAALMLYRQAADYVSPDAKQIGSQIYRGIAQCEFLKMRPLAGRAALDVAARLDPGNTEVQKDFDHYITKNQTGHIHSAIKAYKLMTSPEAAKVPTVGTLADLREHYVKVVREQPNSVAANYNMALCCAWMGDNSNALVALENAIRLEPDEKKASEMALLGIILRQSDGMESEAEFTTVRLKYLIRNPEPVLKGLTERKDVVEMREAAKGVVIGAMLDKPIPAVSENLATYEVPVRIASITLAPPHLLFFCENMKAAQNLRGEMERSFGMNLQFEQMDTLIRNNYDLLGDVARFRFPKGISTELRDRLFNSMIEDYFEGTFLSESRRSLGNANPLDASALPASRRKVLGLIQYMEELAPSFRANLGYDMDRLRHKLNLPTSKPITISQSKLPIADLNTQQLAELPVADLPPAKLREAFTAAKKLDANDLANHFALAILKKDVDNEKPDELSYIRHVVEHAVQEGKFTEAEELVRKGMGRDMAHNHGKHQKELKVLLLVALAHKEKISEIQIVEKQTDELISQNPGNLDLLASIASRFIKINPTLGKKYAQQGHDMATKQNLHDQARMFAEWLR